MNKKFLLFVILGSLIGLGVFLVVIKVVLPWQQKQKLITELEQALDQNTWVEYTDSKVGVRLSHPPGWQVSYLEEQSGYPVLRLSSPQQPIDNKLPMQLVFRVTRAPQPIRATYPARYLDFLTCQVVGGIKANPPTGGSNEDPVLEISRCENGYYFSKQDGFTLVMITDNMMSPHKTSRAYPDEAVKLGDVLLENMLTTVKLEVK